MLPRLAKYLAKPKQEVQSRNIGPTRLKMDQPLVNNTAFHLTFHDKDINKRSWFPKAILRGKRQKENSQICCGNVSWASRPLWSQGMSFFKGKKTLNEGSRMLALIALVKFLLNFKHTDLLQESQTLYIHLITNGR